MGKLSENFNKEITIIKMGLSELKNIATKMKYTLKGINTSQKLRRMDPQSVIQTSRNHQLGRSKKKKALNRMRVL